MSLHSLFSRVAGVGVLSVATALGLGGSASADPVLITGGHWDIDVEYDAAGQELEFHWHLHNTSVEYEPDEVILYLDPAATGLSRPAGAQWDFLGTGAGESVYILPFDQPADMNEVAWLGLGAEEIASGTFNPNSVRVSLVGFEGPGNFSLFTTDSLGNPTVFMATADGIGDDFMTLVLGSHRHANWAFTELGLYSLTLQAEGILPNGTVITSGLETFQFTVGPLSTPVDPVDPGVIPEPASIAMMGMGILAVGGTALRRRRKRSELETV